MARKSEKARQNLLARWDEWSADPDSPDNCDVLCEIADYLDLDNQEYSAQSLRDALEADDVSLVRRAC